VYQAGSIALKGKKIKRRNIELCWLVIDCGWYVGAISETG